MLELFNFVGMMIIAIVIMFGLAGATYLLFWLIELTDRKEK